MILEKEIEAEFVVWCANQGCLAYKLNFVGKRGAPDRMVICPKGKVVFIELKRPGGEASSNQLRIQREWRNKGHIVEICDDLNKAKIIILNVLRNNKEGLPGIT